MKKNYANFDSEIVMVLVKSTCASSTHLQNEEHHLRLDMRKVAMVLVSLASRWHAHISFMIFRAISERLPILIQVQNLKPLYL